LSLVTPRKGYKSVPWLFGKDIEIPEEWEYFPISEFVEKNTGDWGIEFEEPIPEGYTKAKIIRNTDFKNWDVDIGKNAPIRLIKKNKINQISLNEFDILVETSGGGPDQPLGRTIFVNKNAINNSTTPIAFSNFLIRFKIKNMNSKFLYYFLQRWYQTKLMKNFEKQTTNLRNFDMKFFLKAFPICSPKLQEQQKIVTILSNVDDLIESTGKVITHSKKVKTGLMQKLLTRGIGHTKFKKITLGLRYMKKEIPLDWEVVKIGNHCESIVSGRNKPEKFDGQIPWLTTDDFDQFYVEESKKNLNVSEIELKEKSGKIIPANSVLIACVGDLGLIGINKIKVSMNQQLHAFVCPKEIVPYFLAQYLSTMKNYMKAIATTTTLPYMNKENCESIVIVIPSLPEQQKIASILSNVDSKITSQEQYKEKLEKLKKSLMQKLLTGEVRV